MHTVIQAPWQPRRRVFPAHQKLHPYHIRLISDIRHIAVSETLRQPWKPLICALSTGCFSRHRHTTHFITQDSFHRLYHLAQWFEIHSRWFVYQQFILFLVQSYITVGQRSLLLLPQVQQLQCHSIVPSTHDCWMKPECHRDSLCIKPVETVKSGWGHEGGALIW